MSNKSYCLDDIQRIRIDFKMPNGYIRHLLLGFTPNNTASDGYDYGYDALNVDNFPEDLNWMIENKRYVIQTVGAFSDSKKYPLGMFLSQGGNIEIYVDAMGKFDKPVNVYVHDALLDTYTHINDAKYTTRMESGEYTDRFFIAFKDESSNSAVAKNSLSTPDLLNENTRISFLQNTKELLVKTNTANTIKNITVYNINGQKIYALNGIHDQQIKAKLPNLKNSYGIVTVEREDGHITTKQIFAN